MVERPGINKAVLFVLYFVTHTHTGIVVRAEPRNLNVFPGHNIELFCYCSPGLVTHNMIHRIVQTVVLQLPGMIHALYVALHVLYVAPTLLDRCFF